MRPGASNAGFSLIEVMCAILVLGIGVVGLTQGITTALRSSKESETDTRAVLLATERLEALRAEGYLSEGTTEGEVADGGPAARWRQSVSRTSPEGLYEIEVLIEDSKTGKPIYELKTMLFEPPSESAMGESSRRKEPSASSRRDRRRR